MYELNSANPTHPEKPTGNRRYEYWPSYEDEYSNPNLESTDLDHPARYFGELFVAPKHRELVRQWEAILEDTFGEAND